jgi:hypothetical protein
LKIRTQIKTIKQVFSEMAGSSLHFSFTWYCSLEHKKLPYKFAKAILRFKLIHWHLLLPFATLKYWEDICVNWKIHWIYNWSIFYVLYDFWLEWSETMGSFFNKHHFRGIVRAEMSMNVLIGPKSPTLFRLINIEIYTWSIKQLSI